MLPAHFNTPEVLTAYSEIVTSKNNLYKLSASRALKEIDDLIYFLRERNGELKRELATYDKRSSWSHTETFQEERLARPLTIFSFRPIYIAKIILDHDAETAHRREVIKDHLSKLNCIIKALSQANMDLAEGLRQKKIEARTPSPKPSLFSWVNEIEMKIRPPKMQLTPHYQLPLNRSPHTSIPCGAVVDEKSQQIPVGLPLEKLLTTASSTTNVVSSSPSPFSSIPPSPEMAVGIPSLADSL